MITKVQKNIAQPKYVAFKKSSGFFSSERICRDFSENRTKFATQNESRMYADLCTRTDKMKLEQLLKTGILLDESSNDRSTVLENLYGIVTSERAEGYNANIILNETIDVLTNPFLINQNFGNLGERTKDKIMKSPFTVIDSEPRGNLLKNYLKYGTFVIKNPEERKLLNVNTSGVCVAAAIEFNLAYKTPSEFARWVNNLTSKYGYVLKRVQLKNIADSHLNAKWLLENFNLKPLKFNFDEAIVKIQPDANAKIRALSSFDKTDKQSRFGIDVLLQSALMQIGSQQSYNSLTDTRKGKFSESNKGLIEFEKNFVEAITFNKHKISITYQKINEKEELIGYECGFDVIKRHLLETLKSGESVIAGYVESGKYQKVESGHEITIIGYINKGSGKVDFIYADTDDGKDTPQIYSEDYLLPKIHHAGLPYDIVKNDVEFIKDWEIALENFKKKTLSGRCV